MDVTQFIIIAAIGRSGSTTLQRIINTIENSNILGENNNFIANLLVAYKSLKRPHLRHNTFKTSFNDDVHKFKPAWYNTFDKIETVNNIKKTIYNFLKLDNRKVLGFREIRFTNLDLIDEFIELFPNTKVILHYKEDVESQINSKNHGNWWKPKHKQEIINRNNKMKKKYKSNQNYYYLSTFENLFIRDEVEKLFKFLGHKLDVTKYKKIINNDRY